MPGGPMVQPGSALTEYLSARSAQARAKVSYEQQVQETPSLAQPAKPVARANRSDLSDEEAIADILDLWESKGIDVSNPGIQELAHSNIDAYKTTPDVFQSVTAGLAYQVSQQITSPYAALAARTGFPTSFTRADLPQVGIQPEGGGPPIHAVGPGMAEGLPAGSSVSRPVVAPGDYETGQESGAIRYANGVIADPETGEIAFPPNAAIPGSQQWFNETVMKWTPDQIKSWKEKLVNLGYLPKEVLKGKNVGVIDQSFKGALVGDPGSTSPSYWRDYYLNYGQVVHQDSLSGGSGGQNTITNLQNIRGGIENDVTTFYRDLYGIDPSKAELDNWTAKVISIGNRLQRVKDLDPGTAATEAKARVTGKILKTPEAEFFTENMEENTRLRDMLVRSVQVANSMGG
jgi:hypothetical protein